MIIADENIDFRIVQALRKQSFEVLSILEKHKSAPDLKIIDITKEFDGILLTEDKDFGEWVFAHNISSISVVFLRYHHSDLQKIISTLLKVFDQELSQLKGYFTTITVNKIRKRKT